MLKEKKKTDQKRRGVLCVCVFSIRTCSKQNIHIYIYKVPRDSIPVKPDGPYSSHNFSLP